MGLFLEEEMDRTSRARQLLHQSEASEGGQGVSPFICSILFLFSHWLLLKSSVTPSPARARAWGSKAWASVSWEAQTTLSGLTRRGGPKSHAVEPGLYRVHLPSSCRVLRLPFERGFSEGGDLENERTGRLLLSAGRGMGKWQQLSQL